MKIHEYQAKELFATFGIPVLRGTVATTAADALKAAREIGLPVVIKAQVLVGSRGKSGGIKIARTLEEVETMAGQILGLTIKGLAVDKVFVTQAIDYTSELYLGFVIDRRTQRVVMMSSAAGGVEIEEVARTSPEKIVKTQIDPLIGLRAYEARDVGLKLTRDAKLAGQFSSIARGLYSLMLARDCSLVEINPLVKMSDGKLLALDAKVNLDDNALFRHPELEQLRDRAGEDPGEAAARDAGLSYVKLDGNIGCVVNGAGLAMATMDLVKRYGGEPANFLDIGGSSSPEKMATAMKVLLSDKNVRAVLVNIFGGITRCDDVAQGLLAYVEQGSGGQGFKGSGQNPGTPESQNPRANVPMVARLTGTNQQEARDLLKDSKILFADDMSAAVRKVIEVAS